MDANLIICLINEPQFFFVPFFFSLILQMLIVFFLFFVIQARKTLIKTQIGQPKPMAPQEWQDFDSPTTTTTTSVWSRLLALGPLC